MPTFATYSWLRDILVSIVTHQAGRLQSRGGSVDSSHSWYSLIVVDEPLSTDQ